MNLISQRCRIRECYRVSTDGQVCACVRLNVDAIKSASLIIIIVFGRRRESERESESESGESKMYE